MISNTEFLIKENNQSHTFIFFYNGLPYVDLGWEAYKKFNDLILNLLCDFKEKYDVDIYLHEREVIHIDKFFFWCFSFSELTIERKNQIATELKEAIEKIASCFEKLSDTDIFNNNDDSFNDFFIPDFLEYYVQIVANYDVVLEATHPPKDKTYQKEDLNLNALRDEIYVLEFKNIINEFLSLNSDAGMSYRHAPDGFFTNKYRSNKYLREELIPTQYFIIHKKISDTSKIKFGVEQENFDAKIINYKENIEIILEITLACPENDHKLFSLLQQAGISHLPMKTMSQLKNEIDSIPSKIVEVINKKHQKNYSDNRILLVIVQSEYVYQGEEYIIQEILKEVKAKTEKGNFDEILLLCDKRFYSIF
ncbi:hypothetical protein [Acinetobacter nectaris]|uniref:hypothetical protein n=1 Tax=Acinetobacter nectaris TaxID=1219382 RepID=UPI001F2E25FA|nr:hypothetical protein [Acinetobacter nectaris]MCF9045740.1 hypothetical protein [Acinetobacter nectaris]